MNKFQRSWQLFRSSLVVMRRDKKLLLFPILTTAITIFIAVIFLMPVAFRPTGYGYATAEHWKAVGNSVYDVDWQKHTSADGSSQNLTVKGVKPLALGYFALMYFVSMFFATFFNVAFYQQILNALSGQPVSIMGGLQFASTKWKIILMWTLFAGLVGFIIKTLEERSGLVGRWILKLLGTAWSIACVFVIPVIITEQETTNPLVVLKKSALTLTRTWGESLIGYAGVSLGGSLIFFGSILLLGGGIAVSVLLHLWWLAVLVFLGWLAGIFILSYLMSVASQIFRCALFLYASNGILPEPYNEEMMALAGKVRKS